MPFFEDHSYRKCVTEFKSQAKPNREWEFYMKNDNFTVYRRPAVGRNPDLYSYKAFGGWKDVKPDTLANVYLDLDFRKKWDKYMKTHKYFEVKSDSKEYTGIHFEMNYPWPLSNRDYAYVMETKLVKDGDDKYQVILGESLPSGSYPVSKGVIRIDTYMQNICITRGSGGQGCTIALDYFDDPKVK
jgi:hypothetical protein